MPNYDYECVACKYISEAFVEVNQRQIHCLRCGAVANRVYLKAPGFNGKNKGLYPAFDIQSGQTFQSSKDRDDYAYKRGRFEHRPGPKLEIMGTQEFERSRNAPQKPHPWDSDEPDEAFIEMAKKNWEDVKYGRIAPEVEEERVMEIAKQADFLDVTNAPKVE